MQIVLRDHNPHIVMAWTDAVGHYAGVHIGVGNLLRAHVDAVVSPANSFGFMDGGIDLAYRAHFGLGLQNRVQHVIATRYAGECPVGAAFVVPTGDRHISRMVIAPTMRTPRTIHGTDNVYQATKAALCAALEHAAAQPNDPIQRLGLPGMGTGIGKLDPYESAAQMKRALDEVMTPQTIHFDT